ncbi:MAG: ATP-binding cassette domain-containing protein [Bacilli bacterium]|nr:ATP-binding cassette domain-containing protein [Bacilli bacterium]
MSVFLLDNICKSFSNGKQINTVLKNINLSFPKSGLFSIVGKSGCGKSTLLNILMGIEKPTSGKIYFNGKDISKMNDKEFSRYHLCGVSLVFQHYNLFNHLTAFENVILAQEIADKSKKELTEKAKELFARFHIENLMSRKVSNLSGGEKQRIAILRSLISNPDAILCDEPTGALDVENSREIMEILREISREKLIIMVSHNKNLVEEFSDYILTLKDGEIVDNKYQNNEKQIETKKNTKIRYSSKWKSKFIRHNLKHNIKKNIFSIIACTLSFSAMFISVGFSEGSKSSQDDALKQNLSIGFATASESKFVEIDGSPLLFEKTVKPNVDLVDKYFSDFKSIRYEENISYFICNYPACYFNEIKVNNFEMVPLYDSTLESFGKEMLVKGHPCSGNLDEIIVNEEFEKELNCDALNKIIIINNDSSINYQTGDEKLPFVKDTLNFTKRMKIVGVIHEFSFLNTPKIYFSYKGAKEFLKNEVMENASNIVGQRITYFDYLENCKNDDPVASYSSYLFITDINEIEPFFKRLNKMKEEPLQITSKPFETKETYSTFINSFSSTLVIFVIIAFAGINFILGMISLSTFLENRKNTAILTCLGARNSSIYAIHLIENYLIIFLSFISSVFLANFLQSKLNEIIFKKFMLKNLILIPLKSFAGIPFGLIFILGIIAFACSTLFTLIPMVIYRHNSLTDELRDE